MRAVRAFWPNLADTGPAHAADGNAPGTAPDQPVVQKPPGRVNATVTEMRNLTVHRPSRPSPIQRREPYESQHTAQANPPFKAPQGKMWAYGRSDGPAGGSPCGQRSGMTIDLGRPRERIPDAPFKHAGASGWSLEAIV